MDERHEAVCRRCGECCGAKSTDPCKNLMHLADGKYFCKNYNNRLGKQESVSGIKFHCIPVLDIIKHSDVLVNCAYRKRYTSS